MSTYSLEIFKIEEREQEWIYCLWREEYNYLFLTIKRLKRLGCNVKELERAFAKCKARL